MPWARASSLHRHLECPASSLLAQFDRGSWRPGYLARGLTGVPDTYRPRVQTEAEVEKETEWAGAAEWGTQLHAAKAGEPGVLEPFPTLVEPWREELWPSRLGVHEVALSYNCRTGLVSRYLGPEQEATEWKNSQNDDCVVGTCDWFASLPGGEPWIDDLKSGWQVPDVVTPQTLFYLMCRIKSDAQDTGYTWPTGRISITHWPRRAGEKGVPTRKSEGKSMWRQVSREVLEAFENDVRQAWVLAVDQLKDGLPDWRAGDQCLYCPSSLICPKANRYA